MNEIDPAEHIARHWYEGMELIELGVDFGEVMTYDCLQIVNRNILQMETQREKSSEEDDKEDEK